MTQTLARLDDVVCPPGDRPAVTCVTHASRGRNVDFDLSVDVGTVEALRAHRADQSQARLALGSAWIDSGLVFTMEDGRGLPPQYLTRLFARACQDGGFPPIRLHDLRHTSASLGLAAGETLVEISKRLGHSQLAITADTYRHVLPVVALASSEKRAASIPRAVATVSTRTGRSAGLASDDVPTSCPPPAGGLLAGDPFRDVLAGHGPVAMLPVWT